MKSFKTTPLANNQVIINYGDIQGFNSYGSCIFMIDWKKGVVTVGEDWGHSPTTSKYAKQAMSDHLYLAINKQLDTVGRKTFEVEHPMGAVMKVQFRNI